MHWRKVFVTAFAPTHRVGFRCLCQMAGTHVARHHGTLIYLPRWFQVAIWAASLPLLTAVQAVRGLTLRRSLRVGQAAGLLAQWVSPHTNTFGARALTLVTDSALLAFSWAFLRTLFARSLYCGTRC